MRMSSGLVLFFLMFDLGSAKDFVYPDVICPLLLCVSCVKCDKDEVLIKSPCGCCFDHCVPKKDCDTDCDDKDVCSKLFCPVPLCANGDILIPNSGTCGCCPTCVRPKVGDKCFVHHGDCQTCGLFLQCCKDRCLPLTAACPEHHESHENDEHHESHENDEHHESHENNEHHESHENDKQHESHENDEHHESHENDEHHESQTPSL